MGKNASPKADKSPQPSPEAPFATFIQLDGRSPVPSQFRVTHPRNHKTAATISSDIFILVDLVEHLAAPCSRLPDSLPER